MSTFEDSSEAEEDLGTRLLRRLRDRSWPSERLKRVERRVLGEIKLRMERIDIRPPLAITDARNQQATQQLGEQLWALLEASQSQNHAQAEAAFFQSILQSLVPDQARILAALSDGSGYPVMHIEGGARFGATHVLLQYISNVGKCAGVQCPELTHLYLQRMHMYGLIDIEPIESSNTMKYEILESDSAVRILMDHLKHSGQRSKIVRHTVKISATGKRLWAVCQQSMAALDA